MVEERNGSVFTHMLVPLDGSPLAECVLPHVLALARTFGSKVTLLQVAGRAPRVEREGGREVPGRKR